MHISDLFAMSKATHPDGGAHLSPAECGFITPEIQGIIERYEKELDDPKLSTHLRGMIEGQLEGIRFIQAALEAGFHNRTN